MILDERTEIADATALSTAGTGLALVGDVIPLSVARNIGAGKPLFMVITIDTAVTSSAAASVAFRLVSDAQAAIAVDGSATEHGRTNAIAKASLVAGYTFVIPVPLEASQPYETFLGVLQDVTTTALTAGKVNAFLTTTPKATKAYPDGI